jgi:hypothetical protein
MSGLQVGEVTNYNDSVPQDMTEGELPDRYRRVDGSVNQSH